MERFVYHQSLSPKNSEVGIRFILRRYMFCKLGLANSSFFSVTVSCVTSKAYFTYGPFGLMKTFSLDYVFTF